MNDNSTQKVITIASVPAPRLDPYSIKNGEEIIHVLDAHFIRLLSQIFHLPYKILLPSDGEVGEELTDGNWTGIIGMVQRSDVDLGVVGVGPTYRRLKVINYSYPYHFSASTFMTEKLKPHQSSLAVLHPFPLLMWIFLTVTIFLFSCVLFSHVYRNHTYQNILFALLGSLLEKPIGMQLQKFSSKLFLSTWIIFAFVITNSYKAVLLSILTVPSLSGIRDIQDLAKAAEQNAVTCYSFKGTPFLQNLLQSDIGTWKSIAKCVQRNMVVSENVTETFVKAPSAKALFTLRSHLQPYKDDYFISEDYFYYTMHAFSVSKKFCCQSYLNERIHRLFAAGIFIKLLADERFTLKLNVTSFDSSESDRHKVLQLKDIFGAFVILCGYALSAIALVLEIAVKRYFQNLNGTKQRSRQF